LDVASSIQDINYTKHGISRNNQWKTRGICKQTRGFKLTGQQGELKQHGDDSSAVALQVCQPGQS
jgi:hypothetical protein